MSAGVRPVPAQWRAVPLLLLLRHAAAGQRRGWTGDDRDRPLTAAGERQSAVLADVLAADAPACILTSAYRRCVQTVEPLATRCGLPAKAVDWLGADAADRPDAAALLARELWCLGEGDEGPVVLCTHGEVIDVALAAVMPRPVLEAARRAGAPAPPGDKGGTWVLSWRDGAVTSASFRPPPP